MSLTLLWGMPTDRPFAMVHASLARRGARCVLLDQRQGGNATGRFQVSGRVSGVLNWSGVHVDLDEVTAAYCRGYDFRRIPEVAAAGPTSDLWARFQGIEDIINSWADVTPACVVNRPTAMAANNSKPYQTAWLQRLGFSIPETLVTTDPSAVIEFWERHRQVIYKSISGVRSIVSRLTDRDRDRIEQVRGCPTQFQQYIPGADYRVHVVGAAVFSCRIVASNDDYRYADTPPDIATCPLPDEVRHRCVIAAQAMDLPFCGIDLRQTPDGEWYAFEVNPSPGFAYFQNYSGDLIDEAVADLLTQAIPPHMQ